MTSYRVEMQVDVKAVTFARKRVSHVGADPTYRSHNIELARQFA